MRKVRTSGRLRRFSLLRATAIFHFAGGAGARDCTFAANIPRAVRLDSTKSELEVRQRRILSDVATLVLDGEVCILRPAEKASPSAIKHFDAEAIKENAEHTMVEDFAAVVGLIKRKNYTIPEPAFFPFDLLTLEEFTRWRSASQNQAAKRTSPNDCRR